MNLFFPNASTLTTPTDISYVGDFPERYTCPISMDLMRTPLLLNDGFFYDACSIKTNIELSPLTSKKLANKNYYVIPSFQQEIHALIAAIQAEDKQPVPNYKMILAIATKAQQTAEEIRSEIIAWIDTYHSEQLNTPKETSETCKNLAKDKNKCDLIKKALSIGSVLYPDQEELREKILHSSPEEIVLAFLTNTTNDSQMKECLIKALQETMMEAQDFSAQFTELTKNSRLVQTICR